jgi:hypothetical protein
MALPDKLTFYAVPGTLAPVPKLFGNVAQYIGRRLDYDAIKKNTETRPGDFHSVLRNLEDCYPIDPASNSEFNRGHGIHVLGELAKMAKQGDIVAADEVTAKWSNVKFKAEAIVAQPLPVAVAVVVPEAPVAQPVQLAEPEQLPTSVVDEQPKTALKIKPKREAT